MKTIKRLNLFLILSFLTFSLTTCDDDSVTVADVINALHAKWVAASYKIKGQEELNKTIKSFDLEFRKDLTYTEKSVDMTNGIFEESGTFTEDNAAKKLVLTSSNRTVTYQYSNFVPDTLVLSTIGGAQLEEIILARSK